MSAKTDWNALTALAIRMTNGHDPETRPFQQGLVYVADNSIGHREADAAKFVDSIDNGFGSWDGFAEDGARRFLWGSATSGAKIEATRNEDGSWALAFEGCDTSERRESSYVRDFALAANLETLVVSVEDGPAIAAVVGGQIEWCEQRGEAAEAAKLRRFAAKLGLSLEQATA
jgi:hypothetical protein